MPFDYKREYREFYMPPNVPEIVEVPEMRFLAVRGRGDPNEEQGDYQEAVGLLYGVAFTLKMSSRGERQIKGYFDYVVPPLEGFWWQEGVTGVDLDRKADFQWLSVIRLPEFVTRDDFDWAVAEAARKKKRDFSKVKFWTFTEGPCIQCMHIGPYDQEPATIARMEQAAGRLGYAVDLTDVRRHHEIYLSDPRKGDPAKRKTVVRLPVKNAE